MPLPVAQIDIEKQLGNETWTNRYLVDLPVGDAGAAALITSIVNAERAITYINTTFTRARHASLAENDGVYQIVPLGTLGQRAAIVDYLPLWCVIRVDFSAGLGRPSRKYMRGCLGEADINGVLLTSTVQNLAKTAYADVIAGLSNVVDPQGDDLSNPTVNQFLWSRQLRRGSKRRQSPVLG